jgi:hypothetical protein
MADLMPREMMLICAEKRSSAWVSALSTPLRSRTAKSTSERLGVWSRGVVVPSEFRIATVSTRRATGSNSSTWPVSTGIRSKTFSRISEKGI